MINIIKFRDLSYPLKTLTVLGWILVGIVGLAILSGLMTTPLF